MKITSQLLRDNGACTKQRLLFAKLFPRGAVVSRNGCLKVAQRFDWGWAAMHLLFGDAYNAYSERLVRADTMRFKMVNPANMELDKALAGANAAYKMRRLTSNQYGKALAVADKAYDRAIVAANMEYNKARAVAFAAAWDLQTKGKPGK